MVAVQSNRDWAAFATHVLADETLITDPRFVDNSDRIANIDDLEALITKTFFNRDAGRGPAAARGRQGGQQLGQEPAGTVATRAAPGQGPVHDHHNPDR